MIMVYENGLKGFSADIISAVEDFLTNGIQAL